MESAQSRAKVLPLSQFQQGASRPLAALRHHIVAPPWQLNLLPLEGEEDDDGGDGDAAAEGCRDDKVVLRRAS